MGEWLIPFVARNFSGRETYRSFVELLVQNSLDEHLVFSIGELGARQITPNARKTLSAQCNQFWLDLKGSEWQHQIIIQRTLSDNHETPGISRQRLVVFADEYDALFLDFFCCRLRLHAVEQLRQRYIEKLCEQNKTSD